MTVEKGSVHVKHISFPLKLVNKILSTSSTSWSAETSLVLRPIYFTTGFILLLGSPICFLVSADPNQPRLGRHYFVIKSKIKKLRGISRLEQLPDPSRIKMLQELWKDFAQIGLQQSPSAGSGSLLISDGPLTLEVLWHRAAKFLQLSLEPPLCLASVPTLNTPAALMKGSRQFRSSSSPDFAIHGTLESFGWQPYRHSAPREPVPQQGH